MGIRITAFEGDTVDYTINAKTEAGGAYDFTGKTVTLTFSTDVGSDTVLQVMSTAVAAELEHDDDGGTLTIHGAEIDWTAIPYVPGSKVGSVLGKLYAAVVRIDGDVAGTDGVGDILVKAAGPVPA